MKTGDNELKIIAVIQARMGSSRLPGKALMEIEHKPMLWHVVHRLCYSKVIDRIVIATSVSKKDDILVDFCKKNGIDYYRGGEEDVLDRYYQAAKSYKADVIVRITSDCPLIDPRICDDAISCYLKNIDDFDGASNVIKRTYPQGLDTEVISCLTLEKIWKAAKEAYQREHVTIYMYERPELFKLYSVENDIDFSSLRWTVDEEQDMRFVKEIYKRAYQKEGSMFFMADILQVLEKEPGLIKINKDIRQKAVK